MCRICGVSVTFYREGPNNNKPRSGFDPGMAKGSQDYVTFAKISGKWHVGVEKPPTGKLYTIPLVSRCLFLDFVSLESSCGFPRSTNLPTIKSRAYRSLFALGDIAGIK